MSPRRVCAWIVLATAALIASAPPARLGASQNVAFVTVDLDQDTLAADNKLQRYLEDKTQLKFDPLRMEYKAAIQRLAGWKRGSQPYVARMTPYAYVAAEMLGASFEILATYNSKATSVTTYHSYFVVNRKNVSRPTLPDLLEFLRTRQASFIYHDRFSTSSYFLPSLFFRDRRVFMTSEVTDSNEGIIPILVSKVDSKSSSALVEQVARGAADLAAVWDGTKMKFENTPEGEQVYFIQLPDAIPNDLLVCARWTAPEDIDKLRTAIRSMNRTDAGEIQAGDYRWWDEFKKADAARLALANLRRIAMEDPAPVTVQVEAAHDASTNLSDYIEAAQQAIRLSPTEFVVYNEDAYVHKDVIWTMRLIHDGAVDLTSEITGSEVPPQRFQISYTDLSDLTKRIGGLIHSRMHRIRYVWPYDDVSPTIIRDLDFTVPAGTLLEARRITWLNPERNYFREGDRFDVAVKNADFFKVSLDEARFPKAPGTGWAYDPMSNSAFRVVLVRPSIEPFMLQLLTVVFILLLAGAAVACVVDLRRKGSAGDAARPDPARLRPAALRPARRGAA